MVDLQAVLNAWIDCVLKGGHDFTKGPKCPRCGAEKGGLSLLDIMKEKRNAK